MLKLFDRNSTKLTISEFYDNHLSGKYQYNVSYQRKSDVWSPDKKSFLIDSILKNYPIPAIFMRPKVNSKSGKTIYEIIDGKQRLESIISFIENKIPLTDYFAEDDLFDISNEIAEEISGLFFKEISREKEYEPYLNQFWKYALSIEYLYEESETLIATVFDRLNRNGEPLNRQELRNAKYSTSLLIKTVQRVSKHKFFDNTLQRLKKERMEIEEFISELLFLIIEDRILDSSPEILDELYEEHYSSKNLKSAEETLYKVLEFILNLNLGLDQYKRLYWSTHFYGLFAFAWFCIKNKISTQKVKQPLHDLYGEYFNTKNEYKGPLKDYKASVSSRTRSVGQRTKRLEAIKKYCGVK